MAKYAEKHFPIILKQDEKFKNGDYQAGLRCSFMNVDESLKKGGLDELFQMKKANPPAKSPLMKIMQESLKKDEPQDEDKEREEMALDSIGCTANVIMLEYS